MGRVPALGLGTGARTRRDSRGRVQGAETWGEDTEAMTGVENMGRGQGVRLMEWRRGGGRCWK